MAEVACGHDQQRVKFVSTRGPTPRGRLLRLAAVRGEGARPTVSWMRVSTAGTQQGDSRAARRPHSGGPSRNPRAGQQVTVPGTTGSPLTAMGSFLGPSQMPRLGGLETTEIESLPALGAEVQSQGVDRAAPAWEALREAPPRLLASWGPHVVLGCGGLGLTWPLVSSVPLLCVSKDTCPWIWGPLGPSRASSSQDRSFNDICREPFSK